MSSVLSVTGETFQTEVLDSPIPVVVDLYATWCGPCKMMAPILEQLAEEMAGQVKFVKVDTDEEPELAGAFGVSSIPTLVVMNKGKAVTGAVGLLRPEQVRQMLQQAMSPAAAE